METPPLTRGRRAVGLASGRGHRNTPAYAGKTRSEVRTFTLLEKHPRLRGEDLSPALRAKASSETPPLTRGRQQRFVGR